MHQDGTAPAATKPVFVDASGRRERIIHRVFLAFGVLMLSYLAMVALALVGPPGLSRLAVPGLGPVLPGPAAAPLRANTGGDGSPSRVLPRRTPSPDVATTAPRPTAAPVATATGGTGRSSSPGPTPTTALSPPAQATRSPGPATPAPASTRTPPGQGTARPSPQSSHGKGPSPVPSPTP